MLKSMLVSIQKHWGLALLSVLVLVLTLQWYHLEQSLSQAVQESRQLSEQLKRIKTESNVIATEQQDLYDILRYEQQRFVFLDNALDRIEDLIGHSKESTHSDVSDRVAALEQSALEKQLMLSAIPNGHPMNKEGRVSSWFGKRVHPILKTKHIHKGIDFSVPKGTPVYATADGVVEFAGKHASGYGVIVIIQHSVGFKTLFAHLSRTKVKIGQVVKKGDLIALSGNTGLSTAPHLHYEVRFLLNPLNPLYFIRWRLDNYEVLFENEPKVPWNKLSQLLIFKASAVTNNPDK